MLIQAITSFQAPFSLRPVILTFAGYVLRQIHPFQTSKFRAACNAADVSESVEMQPFCAPVSEEYELILRVSIPEIATIRLALR